MSMFSYPFLRKSFLPRIARGGELPSVYFQEAGDWVHFPGHCKEIPCPNLLDVERYGMVCEDHYEWEAGIVKANARMGADGDACGTEPAGYDWDILRADPEFSEQAEEHFRKELEYLQKERELSEELLGERNEAMRESEERIREKLKSPSKMKVRRVIDMDEEEEEKI